MMTAIDQVAAPAFRQFTAVLWASLVLAFGAIDLGAATFVVTKETDDDGTCEIDDCALREAVLAANAAPGKDTIVLAGGTYQLSIQGSAENFSLTGDLDIRDELEILGDESSPTIIVGEGTDRVLDAISTSLAISHLTITGGMAFPSGGGISGTVGDLTIVSSTIRGNTTHQDGGGIFFGIGNLTLTDTTVSGNSAGDSGFGGGIHVLGITQTNLTLINSTVSGNSAFSGGGVFALFDVDVTFTNSTIANNTASFRGDAFANQLSAAPVFANTLFVGECAILSNPPISLGGNIESPGNTCQLPDNDRHSIADPGIAGLADNGGPTWTHALLPGSPAIDTAVDGQCPDTDQRGFERPFDGDEDMVATCDVGAYELHEPNLTPLEIPALSSVGWAAFVLILAAAAVLRIRRQSRA